MSETPPEPINPEELRDKQRHNPDGRLPEAAPDTQTANGGGEASLTEPSPVAEVAESSPEPAETPKEGEQPDGSIHVASFEHKDDDKGTDTQWDEPKAYAMASVLTDAHKPEEPGVEPHVYDEPSQFDENLADTEKKIEAAKAENPSQSREAIRDREHLEFVQKMIQEKERER